MITFVDFTLAMFIAGFLLAIFLDLRGLASLIARYIHKLFVSSKFFTSNEAFLYRFLFRW